MDNKANKSALDLKQNLATNVRNLELAQNVVPNPISYIDFHSHGDGPVTDYDGRIQCIYESPNPDGISARQPMVINAQRLIVPSIDNTLIPYTDNSRQLGSNSNRWSVVYAVTGTINTSDINDKTDILTLDSKTTLDFIKSLNPVEYKFKDGVRPHYGLIAQEVKKSMDKNKIKDFAGYIDSELENDNGEIEHKFGLRYSEFIAPLISVVQTQQKQIEELTEKVKKLELV